MPTDWQAIDNRILDPDWYTDLGYHDTFRLLRDEDPVHLVESEGYGRPFWALTRYDDVKACLADSTTFSNRLGGGRIPRTAQRLTPETRHALGFDANVIYLDPPLHAVYRRPVNKHFSVPAVGKLRADIASYVDGIIAGVADRPDFDFVDEVATELPVQVICRMLGVPEEDWAHIRLAASRTSLSADHRFMIGGDPMATYKVGFGDLVAYAGELAQARREAPRHDFTSTLARLRLDGDVLSLHEMRTWIQIFLQAGFETTRNAIGVGVWQLLLHPEQAAAVRDEVPGAVDGAIEEILRWSTPSRNLVRVATADVELGGKLIRSGDWVAPFLVSANRDERQFDEPHRFDITRSPNEHLGLGEGVHKCLGRHLLRLELSILLPALLRGLPDLHVADEPVWVRDTSSNGFLSMPVRHGVKVGVPA